MLLPRRKTNHVRLFYLNLKFPQALSVAPTGQVATVGRKDEQLFKALAKMAERRLDEFNAQDFANTAWAFATVATVGQKDEPLFNALARMAERRLDEFNAQELANTAWAFATVGQKDVQLFLAFAWDAQ